MKEFITYFKTKALKLKTILLEKQYIPPLVSTNTSKIAHSIDQTLLIKSLANLYTKDLLLQLKNQIIQDYEEEIKKQQYMAETPKYNHSKEHRIVINNVEKLLNNLSIVNDAISTIMANQENTITHIKEALKLELITKITIKK